MPGSSNDSFQPPDNGQIERSPLSFWGAFGLRSVKRPRPIKDFIKTSGRGNEGKQGPRGGNAGSFQWGIYFAMVLGAFALWVITSLNNRFTYTYKVSLTYADHENARPIGILPTTAVLQVHGKGYAHLRFFMFGPRVIRNLKLPPVEKETTLDFETVFSMNKGAMRGLEVKSADPANLTYLTEKLASRAVPIRVTGAIRFKSGFVMKGPRPQPDRVLVKGPRALLDTLQFIYTEPFDTNQVQTSFSRVLALRYPVGVSKAGHAKQVRVDFPVGRMTEATRTLKLEIRDQGKRKDASSSASALMAGVQVFPSTIKVTIAASMEEYAKVMEMPLRVYVDLMDTANAKGLKLPVHIEGLHNTFQPARIRLSPSEVEWFLVE